MIDIDDDIILRHLQGKLSTEESKAFNEWLKQSSDNQLKIDDYKLVWQITEADHSTIDFQSGAEWSKLEGKLTDHDTKVVQIKSVRWYYKVAAVFFALAVLSYLLYSLVLPGSSVAIETANYTKHVVLPDGSEVWMNKNSTLSYSDGFKNNRHLLLKGEAFFEVKPNPEKPFVIDSENTTVKVLGTSFNVRSYPDDEETDVYVVTGKVSFSESVNEVNLLLTPGMNGVFNRSTHSMLTNSNEQSNALAWKDKKLVFKKTPLHEVVKVLRNYFKAEIQLRNDELSDCRFTSTFNNPTLTEVMEALSLSFNLSIDRQSSNYVLDGEGCKTN